MRAMVLRTQAPIDRHPLRPEDIDAPRPGADELLVGVSACAICRTDLHVIEGDLPLARSPLVPGHQIVGRVAEAGARCERFRVGDRVGVAWLRRTCGRCRYCRRGRENLCRQAEFTGYHADGGYAEYVLVPEAFTYRIPSGFANVEAAPLLCAGIIGYRALLLSEVPEGGRLGIYGFGSSAHVTLQVARARGAEVYVFTRGGRHRELAQELGASWTGDSADHSPVKLDSAIIFAPAGEVVPLALANLDRGGTLALAGIHMTPVPTLDYEQHLFYERTIRSVTASTRADGEALLAEAARIGLRPETTTFPLAEANSALELLRRDRLQGSGVLLVGE